MDEFKQWVFPCAETYLREFKLPESLQESNKTLTYLVDKATHEISKLNSKIQEYKATIPENDKHIYTAEFNSDYVFTNPFFVWESKTNKDMISDLLSGQQVVVKANVINSSVNQDAIKFNFIGIHFKSENETIQLKLNNTLKGFKASLTHLGNSYYRYADKFYTITGPRETIEYSFETKADGEPVHKNAVYDKMKTGDLLLSSYAMWNFSLINLTDVILPFYQLEQYKNHVDLELIGHGRYISNNPCLNVEDYYKSGLDDTYNQIFWSQNLEEIESFDDRTPPKMLYSNQTISNHTYSHHRDGRHQIEERDEYYQPLKQETSTDSSFSYLKSPLVWMPLSLLAAPLALWGMLASNSNRMRQNLRRGRVINQAANVANPALAIPLLAIKSVEAEQPQASSEKQEASMLLTESINKNPHLKPNKLNKAAIRDNKLKPLIALPMHHSHQNNNTSQITHCLSL